MIINYFLGSIAKDVVLKKNSITSYLKNQNFVIDPDFLNEDYWVLSDNKCKFALSDGATESYNSKLWAKLLCDKFVASNHSLDIWLTETIKEFSLSQNISNMTWAQHSSYERGSFATFIGGELDKQNNQLTLNNIGDSCIFVFKKNDQITYVKPKKRIRIKKKHYHKRFKTSKLEYIPTFALPDFSKNPNLLSSNGYQNNHNWKNLTKTIKLDKNSTYYIIACTDALADWLVNKDDLLNSNNQLLTLMRSENNKEDFAKYFFQSVMKGRENRSMKIDDSTLIILKIIF